MKTAQPSISFVLFLGLLAGCGPSAVQSPTGAPGGGMPPAEVDVISVTPGSATLTEDLPGRLQAYRTAQVRARVEGIVEKRLFAEGSDVRAGAMLFVIDPRTYKAAVEAAKADVEVARLTVERYQPLLVIRAISQQEYDVSEAKLKQAQAALSRAQLDFDNTQVPAPIQGRIGRTMVTEGALVGRGEATHLATIEQIDPIYVNFTQPGAQLLRLRAAINSGTLKRAVSTKVELLLEDGSAYPLPGKILFSDLAVDPTTGAVSLRAEFPNPNRELLPGMFVRIRFPSAVNDQAIRVPQRAVQSSQQGQFVMLVAPDGKATPQPVTTGGMAAGDFLIASGLKGGEQVIVNGLQKIHSGTVVTAKSFSPSPVSASGGTSSTPANPPIGTAKKED